MKLYYVMGLLLLGVLWCKANEEDLQDITKTAEDDDDEFFDSVKSIFEKKCQLAGGDAAVQNLTNAVKAARSCLEDHLPDNKDELKKLQESDSDSSEQLCNNQRRAKVRECFHDFIEVWKDCSQPEEKYFPDFAVDALKAVFDYVCADEEAFIEKVVNSVDCFFALMEKAFNATDVLEEKFKFLNDDNPEEMIITKDELCEDLEFAKSYFGDYIKQECPDATEFKNLLGGLYAAIKSPCDKKHKRDLLYSFKFNN